MLKRYIIMFSIAILLISCSYAVLRKNCCVISAGAATAARASNIGIENIRIAVAHTKNPRIDHAWCEVLYEGRWQTISEMNGEYFIDKDGISKLGLQPYKYLTPRQFFYEQFKEKE